MNEPKTEPKTPQGMRQFTQAENGDPADPKTGQVLERSFVAVLQQKAKNGFSDGWVAMSQSAILEIAKSKDLGADALRVFLALASYLDFDNLIQVSQVELGHAVNMRRQNVQRAIKRLVDMEIMIEGPRSGVHRTYRLNPQYGWKGSAKSHRKALDERRKATQEAAQRRANLRVIEGGSAVVELFDGKQEVEPNEQVEGQGELELG